MWKECWLCLISMPMIRCTGLVWAKEGMGRLKKALINLISRRNPIFAGNLTYFGFLRVIPAALSMYLLIPVYIFHHLVVMILLYNWIICPLLGVQRIRLRNYIIIDRHKLPGLSYTGRFHCIYCGYANGICVAMGVLLTQISQAEPVSAGRRVLAALPYLLASTLSSIHQSLVVLFYNIGMAPPMGLHRLSYAQAYETMERGGFGDGFTAYGSLGRALIRYEQSCVLICANALGQVESQWCPVKHLHDNPDAVFPEHQQFFVERCELCELKHILGKNGSVSPRKPMVCRKS